MSNTQSFKMGIKEELHLVHLIQAKFEKAKLGVWPENSTHAGKNRSAHTEAKF